MKSIYTILSAILLNGIGAEEMPRTIEVSGKSTIIVEADRFNIICLIIGHDNTAIDIAEKLAQGNFDELIKVTGQNSLVITGRTSSMVTKNLSNGESVFNGYDSVIQFPASSNEIESFRFLYKTLLEVGLTQISSVNYISSKQIEQRETAREMALLAAKKKATQMAETMNVKIGRVMKNNEVSSGLYNNRIQNSFSNSVQVDSDSQYMEGKIEISENVNLVFELL